MVPFLAYSGIMTPFITNYFLILGMSENTSTPASLGYQSENARTKKRLELDSIVFDTIQHHPGYTLKQIQKLLSEGNRASDFDISFLTNSLARLKKEGKIFSQTKDDVVHGKVINTYYIQSLNNEKNNEFHLKFKKNDLQNSIGYLSETDTPIVSHAINREKIIVTIANNDYYNNITKFSNKFIVNSDGEWIKLKFHDDFITFYDLEEGKYLFRIEPDEKIQSLILTRVANKLSKDEKEIPTIKRILILEDEEEWAQELTERLETEGYEADYATSVPEFKQKLKEGAPFDFISLDKKIIDETDSEDVAGELFFEIKRKSPNAKVGILSRKIEPSEFDYYQELGFICLLLKRPRNRNRETFNEVGDELLATLKVI